MFDFVVRRSGWLRNFLVLRRVEGEDPVAIDEWRRRHLPVIGKLLPRLQSDTCGARLAFSHIGLEAYLDVILMPIEIARKHIAVFDRHITPCAKVGMVG